MHQPLAKVAPFIDCWFAMSMGGCLLCSRDDPIAQCFAASIICTPTCEMHWFAVIWGLSTLDVIRRTRSASLPKHTIVMLEPGPPHTPRFRKCNRWMRYSHQTSHVVLSGDTQSSFLITQGPLGHVHYVSARLL